MTIKEIRALSGLSQSKFAEQYNISINTLQAWEAGRRTPPEHTRTMLERLVTEDTRNTNTNK